jgi:hypothetical protein
MKEHRSNRTSRINALEDFSTEHISRQRPIDYYGKGEELTGGSRIALVLVLLCTLLALLPTIPKSNALDSYPYLSINPTMYVAPAGEETFDVTVDVIDVRNLNSYKFSFFYNNSLLQIEQVSPGSFFPSAPLSCFKFDNKTLDSVDITCSLNNATNSASGTGTLALITLRAIDISNSCLGSPLELRQTLLLDPAHVPIVHDLVGAVYFWKSASPDPPIEGRLLDVYTQRGGIGQGQADGNYKLGEEVKLISKVTYNGQPVQQKLVAFQVQNPSNQVSITRTGTTDQNGLTMMSFRIPNVLDSIGTWTVTAVVEIAEKVAWDIVTFEVTFMTPVGGFSTVVRDSERENPVTPYHMTVFAFILVFVMTKLKAIQIRSQHSLPSSVSERINFSILEIYSRKLKGLHSSHNSTKTSQGTGENYKGRKT